MAQILLVDDEKVARALYHDFLSGAGHQVTALPTAAAAREALARASFDLVVTDLILTEGDGMQLLEHVKSTRPDVPVLVITALDRVEPAVRAIKSGAADYLVKPMTPEGLAHAVNRAVTERALLKENEHLRRHVTLLEAGQRISTTLERAAMLEAAGQAFLNLCGAKGVALMVQEDGTLEPGHEVGFPASPVAADALAVEVTSRLPGVPRGGQLLPLDGSRFPTTWVAPVIEGETLLGAVVLGFEGALPADRLDDVGYLNRHLGLALRNLGKFSRVEDLVYLDDLTHLFNSRYLELILEKEFRDASASERPFSLLFLDLDYFKSINDTYGHVVGSKLLVEVSRVLKNCVRDHDVVCRWGGDEYVTLLRGTDSGGALRVAERIRNSIESHHFLSREGFAINVTTCIGVASYPEHAQDKDSLIDFADRAMYRGKRGSRNIIYTAAPDQEQSPASRHQAPALPMKDG